jgi:hypothetical protein
MERHASLAELPSSDASRVPIATQYKFAKFPLDATDVFQSRFCFQNAGRLLFREQLGVARTKAPDVI